MLRTRCLLIFSVGALLLAVLGSRSPASGDEREDRLIELKKQFDTQQNAGRLDDAVQTGRQLLALADEILPKDSQITAIILNDWALVCSETGNYRDAQTAYQRALSIVEKQAGKHTPQAAAIHFNLGGVFIDAGQDDPAERHYSRCIEIVAAHFGADHPHTVNTTSLNNLAEIYRRRANYAKAEQLHKRALAIRQKSLPPDSLELAISIGNLGLVYFDQGRYAQAEPLYKRTLTIKHQHRASALPEFKTALHNLGRLFQEQARYEQAADVFQQLLAIARKDAQPDGPATASAIHNLAQARLQQCRYAEAEKLVREALAIWRRAGGPAHPDVALGTGTLAAVLTAQGKLAQAERLHEQAFAILEKSTGPNHPWFVNSLNNRAGLAESQRQYDRAEQLYQQALQLGETRFGPRHTKVADSLAGLGNTYFAQGRFADAELVMKRALSIRIAALGNSHPDVAACLNNLAALYGLQGRYQAAEPLYKDAIAIGERALGHEHPQVANSLSNLAQMYVEQGRLQEAEPLMQESLAIKTRILPAGHPGLAVLLNNMAMLHYRAEQYDQAAQLLQKSLDIRENALGKEHVAVAGTLNNLAYVRYRQGQLAPAKQRIDRAIALRQSSQHPPMHLADSYYLRSSILWEQNEREAAVADLEKALGMYEQQRGSGSGGGMERAELFGGFAPAFERMVGWQIELGNVAEAIAVAERARCRSLVDQLHLQGVDLLAGVPDRQAATLRERDARCRQRVAELERQLQAVGEQSELTETQRRERLLKLVDELDAARHAVVAVHRDIRNLSPAYRLAVGSKFEPVPLATLQQRLSKSKAILLQYVLGSQAGFVFVVPAEGEARAVELTIDPEQAKALGCQPGPLTADRLTEVLSVDEKTLFEWLSDPDTATEVTGRLAQLWPLLVPAAERELLTSDKCEKLIVVPDGALALLPFEALVVRDGEQPQYLLDTGPPVVYAPSSTVLCNLAGRESGGRSRDGKAVLSVGDPAYQTHASPAGTERSQQVLDGLGPRYRFARLRGDLAPLPFSATESDWVADVFDEHDMPALQLQQINATEANVRANAAGREVVHMACHGLVDQAFGNFFGALAVAANRRGVSDPQDDGFLTLAEIYELDLKSCELAILSACETNYGPEQKGEGVWALSRGFLVAGSRRVVASNWLVDDEAAASLVTYFCGGAVKAKRRDGSSDYATALHRAKRWVRNQEKWSSPYYWATFVLIGPN